MTNEGRPNTLLVSQLMIYAEELRTLYKAARYQSSELDEALKRLDELDASKSNFVQLVSHELRTPVAVIAGYVEILDEMLTGRLADVESGFLKTIYRQTQHLSVLVQQLTEFSQFATDLPAQLPSSEMESEGDLAAILRSELEAVTAAEIKPLNFELQAPQTLPLANIEPTRFRLIVRYLLSNAVKFNIENGWIKIDLQTHSEPRPAPDLEIDNQTQTLVLEIGNSGASIPSDQLDVIFESFRQVEEVTRRHQGGLGIGLTIVGRAVASLSGQVEVRSDTDGTFFTIKLPYRVWEDPLQLKQKLQQMQSLVVSYAQDLRQLYNAEREKREQLAQINSRLNALVTALLTNPTSEPQAAFEPTDLASVSRAYLKRVAEAKGWEAYLDYPKVDTDGVGSASSPTDRALAVLIFRFMQVILSDLCIYTQTVKVLIKLEQGPQLSLSIQYWEGSNSYLLAAPVATRELLNVAEQRVPYLSVSKKNELDVNEMAGDNETVPTYEARLEVLKQQVKLLGGSFWFEPSQADGGATIIIKI